jgi:hypothetical protein
MPTKTKPPLTLPAADRRDAADLVRHLIALRTEIENVVETENLGLSAEARENLIQAAVTIAAQWYNSGKE